jgi:CHAT domain-containing protein
MKCVNPALGKHILELDALDDAGLRHEVKDHLLTCLYCKMQVERYQEAIEVVKAELENHITAKEASAFVNDAEEHVLSTEQNKSISDHLLICRSCRDLVAKSAPIEEIASAFEAGELAFGEGPDWALAQDIHSRLKPAIEAEKLNLDRYKEQSKQNAPPPRQLWLSLATAVRTPVLRTGIAVALVALLATPFIYWLIRTREGENYQIPYRSANEITLVAPNDGAVIATYQEFKWQSASRIEDYTLIIRETATGEIVVKANTKASAYVLIDNDARKLTSSKQYEWFVTSQFDSSELRSGIRRFTFIQHNQSLSYQAFPREKQASLKSEARNANDEKRAALLTYIQDYILKHKEERSPDQAWALGYRGFVLYLSNRSKEAADSCKEALLLWDSMGISDALGYASILINYSVSSQDAGKLDEAISGYEKAAILLSSSNDDEYRRLRSTCLLDLGTLYHLVGLPHRAEDVYYQALAIDRDQNNLGNVAEELGNIGNILVELDDPQRGAVLLKESVDIHADIAKREGKPRATMADALDGLANAYRALSDFKRALALFDQTLNVDQIHGNEAGELVTTNNIANTLLTDADDSQAALNSYQRALDIVKRAKDANPDDIWRTYDGKGRAELNLGELTTAEQDFYTAITTINALRDTLSERQLRQHFKAQRITPEYGLALLRIKQNDLPRLFESIESGRATALREAGQIKTPQKSLRDIQNALGKNVMALEYLAGDEKDRLLLLAITGETANAYLLGSRKHLDDLINGVLKSALGTNPLPESQRELLELSGELLPQPILDSLLQRNIQRIIISPDGSLNDLPFEALRIATEKGDSDYILKSYNVSVVPSLNWWLSIKDREPQAKLDLSDALVVADPFIPASGCNTNSSIINEITSNVSPNWREPLPWSKQEAKEVLRYAHYRSVVLAGAEARSNNFFAAQPANFRILHFATHALSGGTLDTSLLLFGCSNGIDILNGGQIEDMKLTGQLVVLSACETGSGDLLSNEGNDSLMSGFLMAGADSVVASRWRVRDDLAAKMMEPFYENLAAGFSVDDSLRRAKLFYLKNVDSNPRAWASFTSVGFGDMKLPIQVSRSVKFYNQFRRYWWLAILITAATIAAFFWLNRSRKRTA